VKRVAAAAAFCCCVVLLCSQASAADPPQTARGWLYGNLVTMLAPEWGLFAMPGARYELSRSRGPEKQHYFDELFVGPLYVHKSGNLTFKMGLWYYFMGYPNRLTDHYDWSHNIEVVPQVDYRWKRFTFTDRVILHNTFYATVYKSQSDRWGWGTVLRELVQATFWATESLGIIAADEPFFGVIEDAHAKSNGIGYWPHGLGLNRIYAGLTWKPGKSVTVTPLYIYETSYDTKGTVIGVNHYVYTTVSWTLKAY
jgi:hypothetical protein